MKKLLLFCGILICFSAKSQTGSVAFLEEVSDYRDVYLDKRSEIPMDLRHAVEQQLHGFKVIWLKRNKLKKKNQGAANVLYVVKHVRGYHIAFELELKGKRQTHLLYIDENNSILKWYYSDKLASEYVEFGNTTSYSWFFTSVALKQIDFQL